jgi:hypothetical protein
MSTNIAPRVLHWSPPRPPWLQFFEIPIVKGNDQPEMASTIPTTALISNGQSRFAMICVPSCCISHLSSLVWQIALTLQSRPAADNSTTRMNAFRHDVSELMLQSFKIQQDASK